MINEELFFKAYRKLKSYIYYDNSTLFLKEQVAKFEANTEDVEFRLKRIFSSFSSDYDNYLEDILNENMIGVKCYPKSIKNVVNRVKMKMSNLYQMSLKMTSMK